MRRPSRSVELPAVADFISLPFYDLFAEDGHVPKIRESLPPLLTGVRRNILEIGAGTGLITTSLAEWTPAEIFALEPSAGMRGILLPQAAVAGSCGVAGNCRPAGLHLARWRPAGTSPAEGTRLAAGGPAPLPGLV